VERKNPFPDKRDGFWFCISYQETPAPPIRRTYIVRKTAPKKDRDKYASQGLCLITEEENDHINGMLDSLARSEVANGIFTEGTAEESVFWEDYTYGFLCKCRPDWRCEVGGMPFIADLKSCADASEEGFSRACANYNYDIQAAWYLDGINTVQEEVFYRDFLFIAVEKTPPYLVAVYRASEDMVSMGRQKIKPLVDLYAKCLKEDHWPGYEDMVKDLYLPRWAAWKQ
jgi:hypothetical protein